MPQKRDMRAARAKVDEEGACRYCGRTDLPLEAAHIVPRSRLTAKEGAEDPRNILPLCREHHALQHALKLELLGLMTHEEEMYVVQLVGLGEAWIRTTNTVEAA